ncbi:hypothetical protein CR532_05300 (plasmid) [Candidatus Borreliella tachyglossi]|uniref:Uncharacterized protein n=1 Tax=Candidatus Borreliella tachyglossi TaxID=1964448 RepID=A0A2S1LYM1_9SPIR|nr:DUF685 domain-containing protein [Candidatus Borreliella tachyglossi]AWG43345.1 hypothetical protein CR532_04930 [Candidatus Borreliella tachyglossi]AWG43412.1 hypothetical protein CR532_05300 [Candidatus Borreliella tachyglossi]
MPDGDNGKLLVDEIDTIQIKDLNRVASVNNSDLLPVDDGIANLNAITFENFLKTVKDKTFRGEGLGEFKQVIKSTIASELANDDSFVNRVYSSILSKILNNQSSSISNLFSKIESELKRSIKAYSKMSSSDKLLIMSSYNELQKVPPPKQIMGIPSSFTIQRASNKSRYLYPYEYTRKSLILDLINNKEVTLMFDDDDRDEAVYLDIFLSVETGTVDNERSVYTKYSDETGKLKVFHLHSRNVKFMISLFSGWYMHERVPGTTAVGYVPLLLKI